MADIESLQKFDFQFLDAIRDVERDMLTGRNTLLRDVLDFFMDFDIKEKTDKSDDEKNEEIKLKKEKFSDNADSLISELQERMEEGKKQILSYATATGASFNNAKPNFDGSISEIEMFSALRLIVEYESGIKIPATHNGLGYNNLIFMSLLLAKMQVDSDGDYLGSNAKVFSTLAIEEPEAHLHPAMQYKFLKFIKENKEKNKVRQVFISTHSTHITSAVSLGEIICLHNEDNETSVSYPAKVFPNTKSKNYVQRFLDATKSDMLFAHKVIFVEGLAEQLLISIFAQYLGHPIEDSHIAVISVGGRYFEHFLHLFDSSASEFAINKKVACLTDRDPSRQETGGRYEKCYPFEYNQNSDDYSYKDNSTDLIGKYKDHPNIRFFSQDGVYGKTLEYDLILHNSSLDLLITDSMNNKSELQEMMALIKSDEPICKILEKLPMGSTKNPHEKNNRIKGSLNSCNWSNDSDKKKAIIAARYLNSVGKGENAFELACILEENLTKKGSSNYQEFIVPAYIKDAIEWISQ